MWWLALFLLGVSFLQQKKYVLLMLLNIEAIMLLCFYSGVSNVWGFSGVLYFGVFMMVIVVVMAAFGLCFITLLSRDSSYVYLKSVSQV